MNVRVALAVTLFVAASPSVAGAVDKMACIDAHAASQSLRKDGKLRASREKLLVCATEGCPGAIRKECSGWLDEVTEAIPSVVVSAKDANGGELVDVRVTLDGEPLATRLDGKPLPVDPGIHAFRYETNGAQPVEEKVTVRAGEHNRMLTVTFPDLGATAKTPSPASATSAPEPAKATGGIPIAAWIAGGVGVVGLGAFGFFGLDATSKKSKLDDMGCKPSCAQSDVDAVKKDYLFANIGLGVGVVGLGVATYLIVTAPKDEAPATTGIVRPKIDVAPLPGGGFASASAAF